MRGQPWARPPPGPGPAPSNPPPSHGDTHMRTPPRCFSTRTLISMTAQAPRPEDGPCVDGAADLVRPNAAPSSWTPTPPLPVPTDSLLTNGRRASPAWFDLRLWQGPAAPAGSLAVRLGPCRSDSVTVTHGVHTVVPRFPGPQIARDQDRDRETRRLRPGLGPVPASRVAAAGQVRVRLRRTLVGLAAVPCPSARPAPVVRLN